MLTLYHAPQSRSTRMLWLLEELGADYAIRYVDIRRQNGAGTADPRNPHPDGKVPALVHDGRLVTESVAIMLYLTDLFPEAGLAPLPGDEARGAYLTWLAYYAGVMEPVISFSFMQIEHPMLEATFRGRREMDARILGVLEAQPFLLGEQFSAADILLASLGHWFRELMPAGEAIDAYLARCGARPALEAAAAKDSPAA
jgi:glutathione S-transferase